MIGFIAVGRKPGAEMFVELSLFLWLASNFALPLLAQSLFDSVNNGGTKLKVDGVNLPPKFLAGGGMENFSLPEDTPVGTIVIRKYPMIILTFRYIVNA